MTAPDDDSVARSQERERETKEQLRTRVSQLEWQLADAREMHTRESRIGTSALVALSAAVIVTTPLALFTVKRWVDWWRE
jgi:hypothetical protein